MRFYRGVVFVKDITIIFANGEWPLHLDTNEVKTEGTVSNNVIYITVRNELLAMIHKELVGIPKPQYVCDWLENGFTWWYNDALCILSNLPTIILNQRKLQK